MGESSIGAAGYNGAATLETRGAAISARADWPDAPAVRRLCRLAQEASVVGDDGGEEATSDAERLTLIERAKLEWEGTFDAIREGIAVISADGRVRRANLALAAMLGLDVRALPGRLCCELWPHHRAMGCPRAASPGRPRVFDSETQTGRQFEERAHRLPDGGVVLGLEDVTEREAVARNVQRLHAEMREANAALRGSMDALEREQRRSAQAEGVASLAHLAAGLAHEINNPLGIITQNLGHALADAAALAAWAQSAGDPAAARARGADLAAALGDARVGAARIGRIVAAIGEFGEGGAEEAGGVDAAAAARAVAAAAAGRHGRGAEELSVEVDAKTPAVVGARRDLERVLDRLVDNALEASPGGRVGIRVGLDGADAVVIRVSDAGPGLPDGPVAGLFEPFVSVGRPSHHLGLGLTLARALAERMGASLTLGREGDSTVATLRLRPAPSR
jgi:signal transduction histidine kinase